VAPRDETAPSIETDQSDPRLLLTGFAIARTDLRRVIARDKQER
jgi:hypothetical protein